MDVHTPLRAFSAPPWENARVFDECARLPLARAGFAAGQFSYADDPSTPHIRFAHTGTVSFGSVLREGWRIDTAIY